MANALKFHFTPDEAIEKLYQRGFMDGANAGFLQTLIDSTIEIEENAFFWQEHFRVEGNEYDIDRNDLKKNPAWTVKQGIKRTVPMADAMAPLSETMQLEAEGMEEKTGSIYQYGKGLFETSMSKLELQARLRELGADENLVVGFIRGVADLVKTHNLRVSHMGAMTLSRGGRYGNTINVTNVAGGTTTTQGFSGVVANQSAYIPLTNYKRAGTKVWTSADCDIPEQMRKIEYDFKEANYIPDGTPFEWDIPWNIVVNVLLKNAAFIKEVNRYIALYAPDKVIVVTNGGSSTKVDTITYEQLVLYSRSPISKISPIRIVREQQVVQGITTYTTVKGWAPGVAVLRPLGYAGVLVHAKVADVELMKSGEVNKGIDFSLAKVQGFLNVINKVTPNGMLKSYHTDVIGRYATVLDESPYHVVVDTTTADN
jgi:hypothetical protein|nr:MAG TPA: hypothetical protein [Caudoviricetes sp.]